MKFYLCSSYNYYIIQNNNEIAKECNFFKKIQNETQQKKKHQTYKRFSVEGLQTVLHTPLCNKYNFKSNKLIDLMFSFKCRCKSFFGLYFFFFLKQTQKQHATKKK